MENDKGVLVSILRQRTKLLKEQKILHFFFLGCYIQGIKGLNWKKCQIMMILANIWKKKTLRILTGPTLSQYIYIYIYIHVYCFVAVFRG
jgi:hypothetical protein